MRRNNSWIFACLALWSSHASWVGAQTADAPSATIPTPYLSPAEEAKLIQLPPGYRLELVVGDPIIKEPVACAFDGNGRMYVAEMRTYMQDIDGGAKQLTPGGRVSLHWSSRGDGNFDRHTVFADNLILPRMILPLADGVLINETDSNDLWLYRDTDGDGVADKKELVLAGGRRGGNLEHQASGLIWGLDNWMYSAVNSFRLRLQGTNFLREATGPNGGQWGVGQDDYGKPWFVNAGGEVGPLNFQVPIVYGAYGVRDQFAPGFPEVWPLVGLADVQGGTPRFRPSDKTLNHFTATCGGEIFRGDRLPASVRGDLFFGEPVGRLVRQGHVTVREGITQLSNPYEKSEFIRATDPNFRPVNMANAPDGTLYIVDMYRGIIQEGNWVQKGSYLRPMVQKYELEKNFGRGRIWRLAHQDFKPGPTPHMLSEKPAQLVAHLSHPNGWWRETAQKLLVLRNDQSVVPALARMARSHKDHLARIHALWTLEGLDALAPDLLREKLRDADPQVRIAAIRTSESLYKKDDKSLVPDVVALAKDSDPAVVLQVLLTAHLLKFPDSTALIESVVSTNSARAVTEIGTQLLHPGVDFGRDLTAAERKRLQRGELIFKELCFACHGPDGKGMPLVGGKPGATIAPPFTSSKTVSGLADGVISVVLKGLSGPVNGKTYDALMVPMESNDDEWIASVASYVRNRFGKRASLVEPADVARVRAWIKGRTEPWTLAELQAALPQTLTNRNQWKVSASHRSDTARAAIDGDADTRFDTGASQVPGMWFQIELPQATPVAGLRLDSVKSPQDYPRGYKVELSNDGHTWGAPVAAGKGTQPVTDISFAPATTRFIRITQTGGVDGLFWSIHELQIWQPGDPALLKTAANKKPAESKFQ